MRISDEKTCFWRIRFKLIQTWVIGLLGCHARGILKHEYHCCQNLGPTALDFNNSAKLVL